MASLFDTNEINSTFYRIPDARQTASWARRVRDNPRFRFTAKLYRAFTHERTADPADREAFLTAMKPLEAESRLGAVLVQFPFSFHDTRESREILRRTLAQFETLPLAVEFRHGTWDRAETVDLLSEHGAAFVNIDQPALQGNLGATNHVAGPVAYYRFHGRNAEKWFGETSNEERYNYLYSGVELEPWIRRIRDAVARPGTSVYAILNNHFRGQAVANALTLQKELLGEVRPLPRTLVAAYPTLAAVAAPSSGEADQRRLF